MNTVTQNSPLTAATIVSALVLVLAAFTELSEGQVAAVAAVVSIVAGFVLQRYGTDPKNPPT